MKTGYTLFLAFFALVAQAQNTPLSLGIQISPNYSYRSLSANDDNEGTEEFIKFLDNRSQAGFGYRVATVINIPTWERWTLETGVAYSNNSFLTEIDLNQDIPEAYLDRRGFNANSDEFHQRYTYTYLSIPVRMIWSLGTEKTKFLLSAGGSARFLLDDEIKNTAYINNEEVNESISKGNYESFNLAVIFGIGAQFTISERLFLRTEAIARYGLLDASTDDAINTILYGSELNLGLYYLLKP